jgi:hypothetical protein
LNTVKCVIIFLAIALLSHDGSICLSWL